MRHGSVSFHSKAAAVKNAFDLLRHAGIAIAVPHTSGTGLPLSVQADESCIKPLFLDGGLIQTALNRPIMSAEEFQSARFINEGSLAEQFVGQELYFRHRYGVRPSLYYWLREGKSTNAEVDYLLSYGTEIIPVEVKSVIAHE